MKKIKRIIVMICFLSFFVGNVNAANIASEIVTYENASTSVTNVKGALDELYSSLNMCKSGNATANKILSGYKTYYNGELITGTISSKSAATYTPKTSDQTIDAGQYLSGTQTIKGDSNLVASNIACGTTIFGVTGTYNCLSGLAAKVKVGDYVKMTPKASTFTISSTLTGYDSDQTINPSELNLWRIIKINNDGTIEMVSEYVSSTNVYFKGQTGFLNFAGALNMLASAYENVNYTIRSRHMGYSGQVQYLAASSISDYEGGMMYTDLNLVRSATGGIIANKAGTTTASTYWVADRYIYSDPTYFGGRYINESGGTNSINYFGSVAKGATIRPIVTLKSGINASSGSGTSSSPWVLS